MKASALAISFVVLVLGAASVGLPTSLAGPSVGLGAPVSVRQGSPSDSVPLPIPVVNISGQTIQGNLHVVIQGNFGFIIVTVCNNTVYGDLTVTVSNNRFVLWIQVVVSDNLVERDLGVRVGGNSLDRYRGLDIDVAVMRNKVGQDLEVDIDDNWVKRDLLTSVVGNRVNRDVSVSLTPRNYVNNMHTFVKENRACGKLEVRERFNVIDRTMTSWIQENKVCEKMTIEISFNQKPPGWPELFTLMIVNITANHVVDEYLWIQIEENDMAIRDSPVMLLQIFDNGARAAMHTNILRNRIVPGSLTVDMRENAADGHLTVLVMYNVAARVTILVTRNFARAAAPQVTTQADPQPGNGQRDMQTQGGDRDFDGLSDAYEHMIGTDPAKWDTDSDGLHDGWNDLNGNKRWDAGEGFGEIGDPRQPGQGGTNAENAGNIATLFVKMFENPNPLCPDLYVEVDHMNGHPFPGYATNTVARAFKRQGIRLHIDDGWPEGTGAATRGLGGGEVLPHIDPFWIVRQPGANNDFYDLKQVHFDANRRGIFHYAIIGHSFQDIPGSTGGVPNRNGYFDGDDMFIADDWVATYARQQRSTSGAGEAGTFMHELGHSLGLVPAGFRPTPFGGIDEPLTDPGNPNYDPALYANYTSIMNYHYQMIGPVDYSDGSHGTDPYGNPDFDDWSAINVSRISSDWNVYEG